MKTGTRNSGGSELPLAADRGCLLDVLRVAFPLIMAASSHALKLFTDRIMLSRHSPEALGASLSAGITCFTLIAFFMGTAGYANTFVAQYTGARRLDRVGASVWQGIYLALGGGLILSLASFAARPLFALFGHGVAVEVQQTAYFRILASCGVLPLLSGAVLSFWSGRGRTWIVFAISFSTVLVNVGLNWILISGNWGFPRLGIAGAGLATVTSSAAGLVFGLCLFWSTANRKAFDTLPAKTFDRDLFVRLLRFGVPNGVHMLLDVAAFNAFVVLLGRVGQNELEASAIAFSMNAIGFVPMIGLGMSVVILVGQAIGAEDVPLAKRSVASARTISLAYMGGLALLFIACPDLLVRLFSASPQTHALARQFLRYIAAYLVFDGIFIIYHSAVKGAGDTHFAMYAGVAIAWVCMVFPCYLLLRGGYSVWAMWSVFVVFVMLAATVFYLRYRSGRWETMRVI